MKQRYHGIATAIIGLMAVAAVGGYYISGAWRKPVMFSAAGPAADAVNRIKVPSADQVREMNYLYERMAQLASPTARTLAARPLTLFGFREDGLADRDDEDGASDGGSDWDLPLTLTVLTGFRRYCVLDGHFLAEGAVMASGGQILKIEARRVLVAQGQERRWINLEEDQSVSAATPETIDRAPQKGQS